MHPENTEAGKEFGARHGFKECTGAQYLQGYIWDNESKRDWLRECMLIWEKNISTNSVTVGTYPQESYVTMEL